MHGETTDESRRQVVHLTNLCKAIECPTLELFEKKNSNRATYHINLFKRFFGLRRAPKEARHKSLRSAADGRQAFRGARTDDIEKSLCEDISCRTKRFRTKKGRVAENGAARCSENDVPARQNLSLI